MNKITIAALAAAVTLGLAGCAPQAKAAHPETATSASHKPKVSAKQREASQSSKTKADLATVRATLMNHGFSVSPRLYNGQDAGEAMEQRKAPQNLVHDYSHYGYFADAVKLQVTAPGGYVPVWTGGYQLTATELIMSINMPNSPARPLRFAYHLQDGQPVFASAVGMTARATRLPTRLS